MFRGCRNRAPSICGALEPTEVEAIKDRSSRVDFATALVHELLGTWRHSDDPRSKTNDKVVPRNVDRSGSVQSGICSAGRRKGE
jgi:hypothetical protein